MNKSATEVSQILRLWASSHPDIIRIVAFGCDSSSRLPPGATLNLHIELDGASNTEGNPYFLGEHWIPAIREQLGFGVDIAILPPGQQANTDKRGDYFIAYQRSTE